MTCYRPLQAHSYGHVLTTKGKRLIIFGPPDLKGDSYYPGVELLQLPCGKCIGCRLERSRQWALRCIHEASLHKENCFVTLTYNDEHLPSCGGLIHRHFQLFMKRLRKCFSDKKIRFYMCGEYGDKRGRPHYHAILFGLDFNDRVLFKRDNGINHYTSDTLTRIWGKGFCVVDDVTFESSAYVARYVLKKQSGEKALHHYTDKETGVFKKPEYTTMSRRKGIAAGWFVKFFRDIYPHGFLYFRENRVLPPKFYDKMYEALDPVDFERLKKERSEAMNDAVNRNPGDFTIERRRVKEMCKQLSISVLSREVD